MIAQLRDENKKITIPRFYDKVAELSEEERSEMKKAPFDLEGFKRSIGIQDALGEKGYSTEEHRSIRPTLDVNGIWGGYTGEGAKTVIPSKAYAKISMRLVPDQDWHEISELFTQYFKSLAPAGVEVDVLTHHGGYAYVTPIDTIGISSSTSSIFRNFWNLSLYPSAVEEVFP
jgi:acetylornithine deacetylase/succinyl-diaminopimelate desuccinylase-like protein